jgi:hypothetical protein
LNPGSGVKKFGSKIRDKHPGSSALFAPGFTIYVCTFASILLPFYLFVSEEVLKMEKYSFISSGILLRGFFFTISYSSPKTVCLSSNHPR